KVYRVGKVPKVLWTIGETFEKQWGKLGREYKDITFDKEIAQTDGTLEWVTPGHPLFEAVREYVSQQVQNDLRRGAVFFDLQRSEPTCLDVFKVDLQDGRANLLHSRLFVVQTNVDGSHEVRQPTLFLDLIPAESEVTLPAWDPPDLVKVQGFLVDQELAELQASVAAERQKDTATIAKHLEISLRAIIDRVNLQLSDLLEQQAAGSQELGLDGRIKQFEDRLDELNGRLDRRRQELKQECQCTLSGVTHQGRAWVLPHPDRESPEIAPMVSNSEIERIAVNVAIAHEEAQGYEVESVESENRGFDLVSRKPHPEDPKTAIEVRFIEVKGRSGVGQVALSRNEFMTAERLKGDYWLYVVYNCATEPELHRIQNPAQLQWQPWMKVEHYQVGADAILSHASSPVD
ncbi:MAG: protein NO VEIN domain-containing protein, partial [Prochlorothrix sp.]